LSVSLGSSLIMEAVGSPRMEIPMYQTTWCHISEDSILNIYTCKNLKSHILHKSVSQSYNNIFWQNNIHYRSLPFIYITWITKIKKISYTLRQHTIIQYFRQHSANKMFPSYL
jgi:hypothetical protein